MTVVVRVLGTAELQPDELDALRRLFDAAFEGGFDDDDLAHAMGGRHWLAELDGRLVGHASVVERALHVDGRPLRTGYLEAVATDPAVRGRGFGTLLVAGAGDWIRERFELGALSTGAHGFYERLGWVRWRGPSFVRTPGGARRSEDDDEGIMVLTTPASPPIDLDDPISCEDRPGDAW